jgi:hypothetical protein
MNCPKFEETLRTITRGEASEWTATSRERC